MSTDEPYALIDEMLAMLDVDPDQVASFLQGAGDELLRRLIDSLPKDEDWPSRPIYGRETGPAVTAQRLVNLAIEKEVRWIENAEVHGLRGALERADYLVELRDALGQADFIERIASRMDAKGRDEPPYYTIAARIYLAGGQTKQALARLRASLNAPESHQYTNVMAIAELAAPYDRELAMKAVETGMRVIGTMLRVSSIGDSGMYSVDDAVAMLARIGEYRRARDLAESVGRPLSSPPAVEAEKSTPELEKLELQGKGVLGAYVRILDAWIAKAGSGPARKLIAGESQWPGTFGTVLTVFNRG